MDEKSTRRRWFRFSLRTLFVLLTLFGIGLGWEFRIVRERQDMRAWIKAHGGFTIGVQPGVMLVPTGDLRKFPSHRRWFGDEPVVMVSIPDSIPESDLERIRRVFPEAMVLPSLRDP